MRILLNNQIEKVKWNKFVENHKYSNPFQLFEYYESFKKSTIYSSIAIACIDKESEKFKGILVVVLLKEKKNFLGLFSRRAIILGGPLVDDSDQTLEIILQTYDGLIKNKAIYSQFRNFNFFDESLKLVFNKYGYNFIDHLNILKEIPVTEDLLWKQIVRSRKDGINKAKKKNFTFSEENYYKVSYIFYELLKDLFRKIKMPCPQKEYFDELFSNFGDSKIKLFSLKKESERIIILFTFSYNRTLYAYYIGILQNSELIKSRPVDFFYYELLKWCVNNNYKIFDWMGAGEPNKEYGVRKFKLEYGGETINLGRFEKVHNKILFSIGKIGLSVLKKIKK